LPERKLRVPPAESSAEAQRLLTICNACRYCEGYCAVFPALEQRLRFSPADVDYLANLCHNCAECYYACQYAPPHEFAVNVPKVLAEVRLGSYQRSAWPSSLARAFRGNTALTIVLVVASVALWAVIAAGRMSIAGPNFYAVISHAVLTAGFSAVALLIAAALFAGFLRFYRAAGQTGRPNVAALTNALRSILSLENLASRGAGCTYPNEHHSSARRWFHHATFYGFLLCFASTTVAAFDHYFLNLRAPHPYLSLPVVLGALGGVGLLIGPAGLYALKLRRDPAIADQNQDSMDTTFLALLFVTSLTGMALLLLRETRAMSPLLVIHLGVVLALFVTLPYGKFVHGIYRSAALLRYAIEQQASARTAEQGPAQGA
jgi:citrate/tricarballylate utilization protein